MNEKYNAIIEALSDGENFAKGLIDLKNNLEIDGETIKTLQNDYNNIKTELANTKLELSKVLLSSTDGNIQKESDEKSEEEKLNEWADEILGLTKEV